MINEAAVPQNIAGGNSLETFKTFLRHLRQMVLLSYLVFHCLKFWAIVGLYEVRPANMSLQKTDAEH